MAGSEGASGKSSECSEDGTGADAHRAGSSAADRAECTDEPRVAPGRKRCIIGTVVLDALNGTGTAFAILLLAGIDCYFLGLGHLAATHCENPSDAHLAQIGPDDQPPAPSAPRLRGRRVEADVAGAE